MPHLIVTTHKQNIHPVYKNRVDRGQHTHNLDGVGGVIGKSVAEHGDLRCVVPRTCQCLGDPFAPADGNYPGMAIGCSLVCFPRIQSPPRPSTAKHSSGTLLSEAKAFYFLVKPF